MNDTEKIKNLKNLANSLIDNALENIKQEQQRTGNSTDRHFQIAEYFLLEARFLQE